VLIERPDGSRLELVMATEPDQIYRQYNELWQKSMNGTSGKCDRRYGSKAYPSSLWETTTASTCRERIR
jgi:hypothetical protein